jgi:hypothetical protein
MNFHVIKSPERSPIKVSTTLEHLITEEKYIEDIRFLTEFFSKRKHKIQDVSNKVRGGIIKLK